MGCVKDKKEILIQPGVQDILKMRAISYLNYSGLPKLSISGLLPYIEDKESLLASSEVRKFVDQNIVFNGYFILEVFEYAVNKGELLARSDVRAALRKSLVLKSKKGEEDTFEKIAALVDQDLIKGAVLDALEGSVTDEYIDKLLALVDDKDEFLKDPKIKIAKLKKQILNAVYEKQSIDFLLENESQEVIEQLFISYSRSNSFDSNEKDEVLKRLALKVSLETLKNLLTQLGVGKCLNFFVDRVELFSSAGMQNLLREHFISDNGYNVQLYLPFIVDKDRFFAYPEVQERIGKIIFVFISNGRPFDKFLSYLKEVETFFGRAEVQELLNDRLRKGSVREFVYLLPFIKDLDVKGIDEDVVREKVVDALCYGESIDKFLPHLGLNKESFLLSAATQEMIKNKITSCFKDDKFSLKNILPYLQNKDAFFADSRVQEALKDGILLRAQRGNFHDSHYYLLNFANEETKRSLPPWIKS